MLFKKKEKKEEDVFYKPKVNRMYKFRQIFLSTILVLGCLGGLSSLIRNANSSIDESLEEQQFLRTYITNFYSYPRTDEQKQFIKDFMLDSSWDISINKNTEEVKVEQITIQQVEIGKKATTYYFTATLTFTNVLEDKTKSVDTQIVNEKVEVLREGEHSYIVTSAFQPFVLDYMAFDEEAKVALVEEYKEGTSKVSDTEKQIITDLLSMFLETYNVSYEQALLFCEELELPYKDSEVTYQFAKIKTATRDTSSYYVVANVEEIYSMFSAKRTIYFVIDVTNQKIMEMKIV